MLSAQEFCDELRDRGFTTATGVPCSYFGGPIELLSRTPGSYVPAVNEGAALAIAAGTSLAGGRGYVMLQNSGFGNLVNPLTSLVMTYGIPVLTFVSLRGWPDPAEDEPQHEVMGPATPPMLGVMGLPHHTLRAHDSVVRFREILDAADQELDRNHPAFVLVEKGAVGKVAARSTGREGLASSDVVAVVGRVGKGHALISTTGYTSRELFALADHPTNFYMQGSMGHALSIGLGVALTHPDRPVIVLDGDGAALMHLGALSTVGAQAPANLIHVILDNGSHESTGGQHTTAATTSFTGVATATGYRSGTECRTLPDLERALATALASPGPHLCVVPTRPRDGAVPPRATSALSPVGFRDRFHTAMRS